MIFSLETFNTVIELDYQGEARKLVLVNGRGVLLQGKYDLRVIKFEGDHFELFDLKKPGLMSFLRLEQAAPDVLHIRQFGLLCVTVEDKTFFLDYEFKRYPRYAQITYPSAPWQVAFLHPCFVLAFIKDKVHVYLTYNQKNLHTFSVSELQQVHSRTFDRFFIASSDSLYVFSSPSLDNIIEDFLLKKEFQVALELCSDTYSSMTGRVYFEYGVHTFFQERDYQRAAHYMRKSQEYWGMCSLLRRLVKVPPYVKQQCHKHFQNAVQRIQSYSILKSHFKYIAQIKPLVYDDNLKTRIIKQFIPVFHIIRMSAEPSLKLFAETWLFSGLLRIPTQHYELLPLVRDPNNTLPLYHCQQVLVSEGLYDILLELFFSRKVYKPALDLILERFAEEGSRTWLVKLRDYLTKVHNNIEVFLSYTVKLMCESSQLAEELVMSNPPILEEVDILNTFIPTLLKYSGPSLVIKFLEKRTKAPLEHSNYLAKLYVQETLNGNVKPSDLVDFLRKKPIKYDPEEVLSYFPNNFLRRERCIVLDLLGKYEEIIHYYIFEEKKPQVAKNYVLFKQSTEVSSIFLMKVCKPPLSDWKLNLLTEFLNEANPEVIDHQVAMSLIPKSIPMEAIYKYLSNAFHSLTQTTKNTKVKKWLQEKRLLDMICEYFEMAKNYVEISEETKCSSCCDKIGLQDFVKTPSGVFHASCFRD